MVKVFFDGQAGNNLFQYFLGRCISKEKDYKMSFDYINKQNNSVKNLDGYFFFNGLKLPSVIDGESMLNNTITFESHIFDWDKSLSHNGGITLRGYFQNYGFYKNYKNFIKEEIFKYNNILNQTQEEDSITLHLRLRDYPWITPLIFYKSVLDTYNYKKIYIVTDEPNHNFVKQLKTNYDSEVISKSPKDDFNFLCNSKNLILSQSTFAWWAGFLSGAKNIYFPSVKDYNCKGIWYDSPKRNINLFVDDEIRYKKIII